jgi:hypothetical protein
MSTVRSTDIVLHMPPGWEDRSQLIIIATEGEEFRANLVVVKEPLKGRILVNFAGQHLDDLNETFDAFEILTEGPHVLGIHSGYLVEYTFIADGIKYQQSQFFVAVAGTVYSFTFSDLKDRFAASRGLAHQMIASAEITGSAQLDDFID